MKIQRAAPANELLAKLIFLILPTTIVGYFLLQNVNEYYSILQNEAVKQSLFLGGGMAIAAIFYALRFRFLPTFVLLLLGMYTLYQGLDKYETGEFDAFFIARQFQVAAILFGTGWVMGWGWLRVRYWAVLVATLTLCGCVLVIAKGNVETVKGLLLSFAPVLVYSVYVVFTAEQIYNYKDKTARFWWYLTRRLVMFLILSAGLLASVLYWRKGDIQATVDNYGGGGKAGQNSMLKKNKDNSFDLKDYSRLSGALGRSNELLFCAHINNFFPNTDLPNPLYLTAFYFTKFDTLTETFERDSTIPYNDLFEPDPSKIALFNTKTDSSVIKNSLGDKLRQTVEVEIYSRTLSSNTYLAPNVGFFVQPITIEKEFRDQFRSAFRAKSYVSALNSAYFVYNVPNPEIKKFQEMRFAVLRQVEGYDGVDEKFMKYYTYMPTNPKFSTISDLAKRITDTAHTPVDKVLAIRNYFLSKDEQGNRLYQYTDNPGIPDLPNASKLMYFLNENHKGYCAYFAGATLFMLRSLGIPSRIAVGFLTEDRSDKNKGWYWYYANQAHAWIQVYFPGYGWLDFDTTVGNDAENRNTPQPDGTPPMQPPRAWLAAEGTVADVDTLKKLMRLSVKQYVYHDKEYKTAAPATVVIDMKVAIVYRDSVAVPLTAVQDGDEATVVSYSEALKNMPAKTNEEATALLQRLPMPIPTDEVYLKRKDVATAKEKPPVTETEKEIPISEMVKYALLLLATIVVIAITIPRSILLYYRTRYRKATEGSTKAYWAYTTMFYYLHMSGIVRGSMSPAKFAKDVVDAEFGTNVSAFMNLYMKVKYAGQQLTEPELKYTEKTVPEFMSIVKPKLPIFRSIINWMNISRCVSFYVLPEDGEDA